MLPLLLAVALPLLGLIAFALAARQWGVDSRPSLRLPHRPNW
jgi:hypothetical protein